MDIKAQLQTLLEDAEGAIYIADRPGSPLPEWTVTFHAGRAQAIREIMDLLCLRSEV